MKYITYVFYYARELLTFSVLLTILYVVSWFFSLGMEPLLVSLKISLPLVFFIFKKYSNHTTLYFLYNIGMRNRTIVLLLLAFCTIDVLVIHFLISILC